MRALLSAVVLTLVAALPAHARPALTSACEDPAVAEGSYIDLDIGIPGAQWITLSAINERRDVVGSFSDEASVIRGFLLRKGEVTVIAVPGATNTEARDINGAGTVVGRYQDDDGLHAFTWRQGRFALYPSSPSGGPLEFGAVNASATIAGSYFLQFGGATAFVRRPSGATVVIDVPDRPADFPVGINDRGDVLLLSYELLRPGWADFFLATKNGIQPVVGCGDLSDVAGQLHAVTNQGSLVGRTLRAGGVSGIVYSRAGVTLYDYPGASSTELVDMNSAGDAIGTAWFGLQSQPFLFVARSR